MRKTAALLSRKVFRPSILGQLLRDAFERIARPVTVRRAAPARRKGYMLEAIEPRLLLSADISYAVSTAHEFTLKAEGGNVVNLYQTGTSTVAGSATLSSAGDVNVNIARGLPLGGDAAVSDTIHIDLDTLSLLDGFVNANGSVLSINFAGGDQYAAADHVTLDTTGPASVGYGLSIKSNSDIASNANFSVSGDLSITSEQVAPTPPLSDLTAGFFDNLQSNISLDGANLTASGALNLTAHSDVTVSTTGTGMSAIQGAAVTSFSGATIDITGNSILHGTDINLTSNVDGTLTASASAAAVKLVAVIGAASPQITIDGSSSLHATGNLTALSKSDVTINASTSPETGSSDSSIDAAVVNTTYGSGAALSISGGALLDATGTASLTASSKLTANTTADANVASTAGAAVAVTVVTGDTTGSISGATVDGSSVSLGASSERTLTTLAKASPGGSSEHSGGTENASETTLSDNNAETSDGGITVAGAVAVTTDTGNTSAFLDDATIGAGSGIAGVSASSVDVVATTADASYTGSRRDRSRRRGSDQRRRSRRLRLRRRHHGHYRERARREGARALAEQLQRASDLGHRRSVERRLRRLARDQRRGDAPRGLHRAERRGHAATAAPMSSSRRIRTSATAPRRCRPTAAATRPRSVSAPRSRSTTVRTLPPPISATARRSVARTT